jgi:portal protein
MTELVAKRYQDALTRLKKSVRNTYTYFQPNYKRFNDFRRFVFDTSLTDDDKMVLDSLKKPEIEFNIGEAYISRLRGEFSKQEPSIKVTSEDGKQVDAETIQAVEDHLRHIIFDSNKNSCEYNVYTDILSGGFSAIKIWTEYANPMSFEQVIKFDRVYDPTLVGFDPLARTPHKGDGRFCFELFPKSREEFEEDYPNIDLSEVDFTRNVDGFNWSYSNNQEDILLLCDFYEKKKRKKKIVRLVNGYVMTVDDYELFLEKWNESGLIEQPPAIKGKPRVTEIETICRYRFIENKVLEYVETDFPALPIIFVDGNSVVIREGTNQGSFIQMTRPYIYNLKGLQQLKNFAGQTLANELENLVQHKFKVAKESLPDEQSYLDAYTNIQLANTLVYKAFKDNDPKQPVPPPMEIQRVPPPGEVISTFTLVDQMAQSILGSYDAALGINDNQLSGTAIVEGASQSNAAAMPYIVGFMQALSQVARFITDLIPKYYKTPRTIPIVREDGSRDFQKINQPGGIYMNYDDNSLSVKVEAGVNFSIQKARALQQIMMMTQASPIFGQFINAKGLKVILDNFEINGLEQLKELADEFMQEMAAQQKQQQQMQQQEMQNNPMMIKAQNERIKMQLDAKQNDTENTIKVAELAVTKQKADTDFMKVLAEMHDSKAQNMASLAKSQAEETRSAVDLAIKHADMKHSHVMDHKQFQHDVSQAKKEVMNESRV